jgi:peptidoglycan/LPS O-acetylase OafA/YrhL
MRDAGDPQYRPDVDGLRAVAVASVMLFHAFPGVLPGGFAGVDIFFVISGFLITGIILGQLARGRFSFARFYERRIRRLFPALVLVLAVCLVLGWKVLLPDEFEQLGRHIAAGALFVSNLALWSESGYFDSVAELKPLLHLWSLGIEEQYYILWPLALFLSRRWLDKLFWPIAVVAAASFVHNLSLVGEHPEAAYYSPASRGWELLLGSMLAHVALYRPKAIEACRRRGNALAIVGALLVVAGFVLIDRTRGFPGWWALLPTLGTMSIIAAGPQTLLNRALSRPWIVYVGLISYPLYLWHWPLLTYARIVNDGVPSWQARVAVLVTSVVLAAATYQFLEKRVRRPTPEGGSRRPVIALATPMAVIAILGALALNRQLGAESSAFPVAREVSRALGDRDHDVTNVLPGSPDQVVVFIGDSHMRQYWPRMKEVAEHPSRRTREVIFETKDGCAPIPGIERKHGGCNAFVTEAFATALQPEVKTVVIGASWVGFITRTDYRASGDRDSAPLAFLTPQTQWVIDGFERVVAGLVASGKQVVILLSSPRHEGLNPKRLLYRDGLTWRARAARAVPLETIDGASAQIDAVLRGIAQRTGATVLDPSDWLCRKDACPSLDELGRPIYMDGSHIRASIMRERIDALDRFVYAD